MARGTQNMLGDNRICNEFHVVWHVVNLKAVSTYEGTAGRGTGSFPGHPGGVLGYRLRCGDPHRNP